MTDAQARVLAEYPRATCVYDSVAERFTVYDREDADLRKALSGLWESRGMAWHDAAVRLADVAFQEGCREAVVLDQIERG